MGVVITKELRETMRVVTKEGFTILKVSRTKHYKLQVSRDGQEFQVILSGTSSDHRYHANLRKQLRHMIKARMKSLT